jgi:hypothetical protein
VLTGSLLRCINLAVRGVVIVKADRELYDALVRAQVARRLDNRRQIPIIVLLSLATIIYLATVFIPWSMASLVLDGINLVILMGVAALMYRSWPR